jgi:cell wall-associated NlpC family hydrolase
VGGSLSVICSYLLVWLLPHCYVRYKPFIAGLFLIISCRSNEFEKPELQVAETTHVVENVDSDTVPNAGQTTPVELLEFARSLIGTPYQYACTNPSVGFDCSGFINYVFGHFNINVPRSSVDFTNVGQTIDLKDAKPGDLILFTGTDSSIRTVGHIGIVNSIDNGELNFIHSSSGKANGVIISPLNKYYYSRFVKVIRIVQR